MAYLDPTKVKSSANDNEMYYMMDVYEQPQNGDLYTSAHTPDHYETADSPASSINGNEAHLDEEVSNNKSIYEDPGHIKENIYIIVRLQNTGIYRIYNPKALGCGIDIEPV